MRRAARKLVLRTRTVRAAYPPPWLRGSAAPDGELPPLRTDTGMGAVGARRAVPAYSSFPRKRAVTCGNDGKGMDMGTQASRLRMAKSIFSCHPDERSEEGSHSIAEPTSIGVLRRCQSWGTTAASTSVGATTRMRSAGVMATRKPRLPPLMYIVGRSAMLRSMYTGSALRVPNGLVPPT